MRLHKGPGSLALWRTGQSQAVQLAQAGGKLQAQRRGLMGTGHRPASRQVADQADLRLQSVSLSSAAPARGHRGTRWCFTTEVAVFPSPPEGASRGGSSRAFHGGAQRGTCACLVSWPVPHHPLTSLLNSQHEHDYLKNKTKPDWIFT